MSVEDLLEPTDTLGMYRGILSNEMNCDKVDTLEWSIAITSRLLLRPSPLCRSLYLCRIR